MWRSYLCQLRLSKCTGLAILLRDGDTGQSVDLLYNRVHCLPLVVLRECIPLCF